MMKRETIRAFSEEIVKAIDDETNLYDATDRVEEYLEMILNYSKTFDKEIMIPCEKSYEQK